MAGFDVKTLICSMSVLVIFFSAMATVASEDGDEKHDYNIEIAKVETRELSGHYIHQDTSIADTLVDGRNVLEGSLKLSQDLPQMVVNLVGYTLSTTTNQWVEKFRQTHSFCEFIEKNTYFVDNVYRDSNLPRTCPIAAGEYYIRNMFIDNTEFPKHLEEQSWRVDVDLINKATREPIIMLSVFADIVAIEEE